jgi:hypothetical protein
MVPFMVKELVQYCWTTPGVLDPSPLFGIARIQDGKITIVVITKTRAWIAINIT